VPAPVVQKASLVKYWAGPLAERCEPLRFISIVASPSIPQVKALPTL
jgi:hypothetical protein